MFSALPALLYLLCVVAVIAPPPPRGKEFPIHDLRHHEPFDEMESEGVLKWLWDTFVPGVEQLMDAHETHDNAQWNLRTGMHDLLHQARTSPDSRDMLMYHMDAKTDINLPIFIKDTRETGIARYVAHVTGFYDMVRDEIDVFVYNKYSGKDDGDLMSYLNSLYLSLRIAVRNGRPFQQVICVLDNCSVNKCYTFLLSFAFLTELGFCTAGVIIYFLQAYHAKGPSDRAFGTIESDLKNRDIITIDCLAQYISNLECQTGWVVNCDLVNVWGVYLKQRYKVNWSIKSFQIFQVTVTDDNEVFLHRFFSPDSRDDCISLLLLKTNQTLELHELQNLICSSKKKKSGMQESVYSLKKYDLGCYRMPVDFAQDLSGFSSVPTHLIDRCFDENVLRNPGLISFMHENSEVALRIPRDARFSLFSEAQLKQRREVAQLSGLSKADKQWFSRVATEDEARRFLDEFHFRRKNANADVNPISISQLEASNALDCKENNVSGILFSLPRVDCGNVSREVAVKLTNLIDEEKLVISPPRKRKVRRRRPLKPPGSNHQQSIPPAPQQPLVSLLLSQHVSNHQTFAAVQQYRNSDLCSPEIQPIHQYNT